MKSKSRSSQLVAVIVGLGMLSLYTESFAQGADHKNDRNNSEREVIYNRVSHARIGQRVSIIPQGHQLIRVGSQNLRYYNGSFYRPNAQGGFIVVSAPLGAHVSSLPRGAISFRRGGRQYHYVNFTYYLWDQNRRDYVVVEEPEGAELEVAAASESTGELFVYPAEGQSDEQRDQDRYECYVWASDQTDYDPVSTNQNSELASNYRRAMSACLEGRGYTVN